MRLITTLICLFIFSIAAFSQTKMIYDPTFAPVLNGGIQFMEILGDGKMLIVGHFTIINGVTRSRMARLYPDGSVDTSFDANWLGANGITSMKLLPDGKILVAGNLVFDGMSGIPRVRRLNPDGSPDTTQTTYPSVGNTAGFTIINKVDQMPDGKILVCGDFNRANGNTRNNIARYNSNGTFDSSLTTSLDDECLDAEIQPDGKYLVAGVFSNVNGNPTERLVRFNANDTLDSGFNAQPILDTGDERTYYRAIELESDGTIFAFRGYSVYGQMTRLNPNGTIKMNLPSRIETPGDAVFLPNGKTLIFSEYMSDAGIAGRDFTRYNRDGTHDVSMQRFHFNGQSSGTEDPFPHAGGMWDGKVLVAGFFSSFHDFRTHTTTNAKYLVRFTEQAIPIKPKFDFDGDDKDDMGVFRPSDRIWYLNRSTNGFSATQFGLSTDIPVASDYDFDGKPDIAVFRDGAWYWLRSSDNVFAYKVCGAAGDIPVVANRTGYGGGNFLVFRPSTAKFYIQGAFQPNAEVADMRGLTPLSTDKPVVADYDGDGVDDLAVFRNGQWLYVPTGTLAVREYQWGLAGDIPVYGDFDGDLRSDFAVFRPSEGVWYINKSHEGFYAVQWGLSGDIPVPADYDGDGKTDIAVYRNGIWYQMRSTGGFHIEQFGLANDIPVLLR
jgi:uncharacterized delta-60 repeat protein